VSTGKGDDLVSAAIFVTVKEPPPTGPVPVITSVSATTGTPGQTQVRVEGSNFGSVEGKGYVELGSMSATAIASWTPTQIVATVPLGSMPGVVEVLQNGLASNDIPFITVVPSITGVSATSGVTGDLITISGTHFGENQGSSRLRFNRGPATPIRWSNDSIAAPVPANATTGDIVVSVNETPSNAVRFIANPTIKGMQPSQAALGATVSIRGNNFGPVQSTSTVTFNGVPAVVTSWGAGSITARLPAGAITGPVVVTVNGVASNEANFIVN
jgi:hypothetical protein